MTPKSIFYAVKRGRVPGVYRTWEDCLKQVNKFAGAEFKKFLTLREANDFALNKEHLIEFKKNLIYSDGGSRENPGISGCGALLKVNGRVVSSGYRFLGFRTTNNVAEYKGLLLGIHIALAHDVDDVEAFTDSLLVVKQTSGEWKVKEPTLIKLHEEILNEIKKFKSFKIHHIYRDKNTLADELSNLGMDLYKYNI